LKALSKGEYKQLSQRLEELARLEELETSSMSDKSKKKSTSGGWGKGFLNRPSKKKTFKKTNVLSSNPIPSLISHTGPSPSSGVSFDLGQNKVQEIPSIPGTRPIAKTPLLSSPNHATATSASLTSRNLVNSSVFSGLVQERYNGIQERSIMQERSSSATNNTNPKKKLSRFAQERMR
jgi:hypothetical protein